MRAEMGLPGLAETGLPGFADLSLAGVLFLCAVAFLAGTIDAIVGGGGLLQLPAMLLLMPGGEAIYSLATNKIASLAGTTAATTTYARRTPIHWGGVLPMAAVALLGSLGGAVFADALPSDVLNVLVLVAVLLVGIYTWRKPDLGSVSAFRFAPRVQVLVLAAGGMALGFWDGIAGPGTGSFLVFLFVGLIGYSFVSASASAKVVNLATNLGALVFFIPAGKVLWGLAIVMAVSNGAGSVLGAVLAARHGSGFVRRVFLTVVLALLAGLGWKVLAGM